MLPMLESPIPLFAFSKCHDVLHNPGMVDIAYRGMVDFEPPPEVGGRRRLEGCVPVA